MGCGSGDSCSADAQFDWEVACFTLLSASVLELFLWSQKAKPSGFPRYIWHALSEPPAALRNHASDESRPQPVLQGGYFAQRGHGEMTAWGFSQ